VLTHDAFLGGCVMAWQPKAGYRAATDPVLLAAACPAKPGDTVLELGCGVAVASLCLSVRLGDLTLMGVERQAVYADLARRNAQEAGIPMQIFTADLAALPDDLRRKGFDHVIANPPYFCSGAGIAAQDDGREGALREATPLAIWIDTARRRLRPKGWLTVILAANRLPCLLAALEPGFGAVTVLPLAARFGRPASRVLVKAQKTGGAPFTLLPPMVMHDGPEHNGDRDDYSIEAGAILRDAAAISWDARH